MRASLTHVLSIIAALSIPCSFAAVCRAGEYKVIADQSAHVDEMSPDAASGGPQIRAEKGRFTAYLQFRVAYLQSQNVQDATLTLFTADWSRPGIPEPDHFELYALKPAGQTDQWNAGRLTVKNAPGYLPGKGVDPAKVIDLAGISAPTNIGNDSKSPIKFSSPKLTQFVRESKSPSVTFIVVRTNGQGGNNCFYSTSSLDDPAAQPRLEVTTVGDGAADLTRETIILRDTARQTISGFGAGSGVGHYQQNFGGGEMGPAQKTQLCKEAFANANMNTLRVWFSLADCFPTAGTADPVMIGWQHGYIDSELLKYAQANGITRILLEPDIVPGYMLTTKPVAEAAGQTALRDECLPMFAADIAKFIKAAKEKYGITFYMTTILNEAVAPLPRQWPQIVKLLRKDLDAEGFQTVKIGACDWPNNDGWAFARLKAIQDDPEAWKDLDCITTHSYAMPASEDFYQQFVVGTNKEYWTSESTSGGQTAASYGVDEARHMLSDLNHGVSTWIHHEIVLQTDPFNTNLVGFNVQDVISDHWIMLWPKYWYYRQVTTAFPVGTVMRQAWSNKQGSMISPTSFTPYTAAGGKRPDGSLAFSIVNLDENIADQPMTIQIFLQDAAAAPITTMKAVHSWDWQIMQPSYDVTLHYGIATLTLRPHELLSMTTAPIGK